MMEMIAAAEAVAKGDFWLVSLLTLTVLEIVLGIDNVIFISILAGKLPKEQQAKARQLGLAVALVSRILLLLSISWVMSLTKPIFTVPMMLGMQFVYTIVTFLRFFDNSSGINLSRDSEFTGYKVKHGGHVYG